MSTNYGPVQGLVDYAEKIPDELLDMMSGGPIKRAISGAMAPPADTSGHDQMVRDAQSTFVPPAASATPAANAAAMSPDEKARMAAATQKRFRQLASARMAAGGRPGMGGGQ